MEKDDDLWDDDYTDWAFHSLLCELEANGEILKQWEQGEPIEKEPKQKPKENEKERRTI